MCIGGSSGGGGSYTPQVQPVQLTPPSVVVQAPQSMQSTPAPARGDMAGSTLYRKKGKRALTIPQTSNVNIPGT